MKEKTLKIKISVSLALLLATFIIFYTESPTYSDFTPNEPVTNEKVATDNPTGLMWEVKTPGNSSNTYTWVGALNYCENLDHAGPTDWRLPNIKELSSIVDFNADTSPLIDISTFPNTQSMFRRQIPLFPEQAPSVGTLYSTVN